MTAFNSVASVLLFASVAVSANPTASPTASPTGPHSTPMSFPSSSPSVAPSASANGTMVGNDKDAHGCIPSAGYSWCDSLQQCVRPWETPCPKSTPASQAPSSPSSSAPSAAPTTTNGTMTGNDKDEHGCIPSAGYSWCDSLQKCVQPFNTPCPKSTPATVEPSSSSSAPSAAPTAASNGTAPGSDRDEHGCIPSAGYSWCDSLNKCIQPFNEVCPKSTPSTTEPSSAPGSDRDEHGCIPSAGYSWCDSLQKCVQPFNTPCPKQSETGNDVDSNGCRASAGEVYCPETETCITPSTESCPVSGSDTVTLDGPTGMECNGSGRCDLSVGCDIQPAAESETLGGLYISELTGNYEIPEGCTATCQGCTEYDPSSSSSVGVFAAFAVAAVVPLVLV